jgi:alcohol dehydrogenase class IV
MNIFTFNTTPSVLCGPGSIAQLGARARALGITRALLVTDPGIVKAGLLEPALKALRDSDIAVAVFDGVEADPAERIVSAATEMAVKAQAQGIIALGGGSSMDVAKLVALLARGEEKLVDIYGVGMVKGARLPLIQIPTTAGTGSEVTPIAIITVGEGEKKGVVSPQLLPDLALLDADLTLSVPPHVTAATGVDAMVHAIESYTSASANNNPLSKALACEALRLLSANIREATHNGSNRMARSHMLLGAMLAGQAFANSPVAAVHALAYPLGGIFHIPHGLSNALVLTEVMRFNAPVCHDAYAELAPLAFPELIASNDSKHRCQQFIEGLAALNVELGLPTRLRDVNIPESALPRLAADAMKQTRLLVNNPRPVSEAEALEIYRAVY